MNYKYTIHVATIDQCADKDQKKLLKEQDPKYCRIDMPIAEEFKAAGVTYAPLGRPPGIKFVDLATRHIYLRGLIRSFKPDIIHSHAYQPDFYNVLQHTSACQLRTLHNEVSETSRIRAILTEEVFDRKFHTSIALCPSLKERWTKRYRKKNWRAHIIPNPVSDCFFENSCPKTTAPQPPYQLGIIGRLERQKGHSYAIHALEILAQKLPLELHIAGGGSLYKSLQAQANSLKHLKVHFLGSLSETEIRRLYDHLDLLLIPSLHEGFPLTVIEAMATGLPVVGTDVCGVCDMLEACGRKAIPIEDGPALATEVQNLLEDKAEYLRFSAAAIQAVQMCRTAEVAEAHHQLYQQLLSQKFKPR